MGTGYVRNDTSGNIANGKVIDATDLDGEFDAIVTAFSTSGHTHDGTTAEGGKVTKLLGTSLTLGDGTAGTDITVTFDGEDNDGILKWMEDEDYFQFNDDILISTNEKLQFRDTGIYISSNADGDLDIVSDGTAVDSINIESAGGITLDAGTAASGVIFEDDGTEMLRIYNSSSDVYIESKVSDKDILIRGNDDGSAVTAVTFDMSAAGLATFGGGVTSTAVANTLGATSFNDANITNVGNIALDSITADGSTITITGNTTFADGAYNFNIASHDGSNGLQLGGTLVTATATELNIIDGVTATTAELNIMDGVTATTAELNIMDGVTATTAELNIMDGGTSATSTTVVDADRVVLNDNGSMVQVAVTDLAAYFDDEITAMPNLVTTAATTVGALNSGSITSGFGTIDTGSSTITTTGLISGGSLDIDNVLINGTTIGHTDDTDLITLANGVVTVAGEISVTTLDIGGTNVTSTAAELNILDGVTATATELNIIDGVTATTAELNIMDGVTSTTSELNLLDGSAKSTSSITIANSDAFIVIDGTTTKQIPASDIATYATGSTGIMSAGTGNTGIGSNVLDSMTGDDADFNTAFGFNAGTALTTGDRNVHVGYNAGYLSTAGSSNVYIGAYAGDAGTGNSEGNNTCVGDSAGSSITDGSENTCLGQGAGSAITTATYQTALGRESLLSNQTNAANTAVGAGSMGYIRGDNNTALGNDSLIGKSSSVSSGADNTAIGKGAMGGNAMTDASNNVAVGTTALPVVTSGDKNTVAGFESAKRLTTGIRNVILGNKAGMGIITGDDNIAIGGEAAMGFGDGFPTLENDSDFNAFTVGSKNIAIGSRAMYNAPTQSDATEKNVAIGYAALATVQDGDNNVGVGHLAGQSIVSGSNNTCVGYLSNVAASSTSNSVTLGNSSVTSLRCQDTSISSVSDERDKKDIVDSTYGLDLLKTFRPVSFTWNKRAELEEKPSWMSDEEWKEEQEARSKKVDPYKDKPAIGFIAQELRDAVPESDRKRLDLVDEQNADRLEAKQGKLIPILVKALQELSAKNDALEARIKTLEG